MCANVSFSFWTWFMCVMQLIKEKLLVVWDGGYVAGFVSKINAANNIAAHAKNTFILRFSDTILGGVSIVFKGGDISFLCELIIYVFHPNFSQRCLSHGTLHRGRFEKNVSTQSNQDLPTIEAH